MLLAAAGCGGASFSEVSAPQSGAVPPVRTVAVTPATLHIPVGGTASFVASTSGVPATAEWIWASADISKVVVESGAHIRALRPSPGTAICGVLSTDSGVKGCATVVVDP
jgi:hypothetical protein